ncbi:hypothetical protein Q3G72_006975 [Acer saccharum]|nr:hypothetical protein Q3G72_006975 [Acer saccharum]
MTFLPFYPEFTLFALNSQILCPPIPIDSIEPKSSVHPLRLTHLLSTTPATVSDIHSGPPATSLTVRRHRSRYPACRRRQIGSTLDIGKSAKVSGDLILELNSDNFDELVLKSKELWIVEFFAPWCGHRKMLAPEWKRAANNLKGKVKLGHVDCDSDKSLMSRFNVQGFPTILVFGKESEELSAWNVTP